MWMLLCFLLVKIGKLEGFYDQSQFQVKRSSNELNVCCSQVDKSNPGLYISRSFVCLIVWACDKQSRSPGAEQSTEVGYVFYPWALMAQSVQPSLLNKNCMSNLPLKASDTWFQRFLLTIEEVKGRNRPCSILPPNPLKAKLYLSHPHQHWITFRYDKEIHIGLRYPPHQYWITLTKQKLVLQSYRKCLILTQKNLKLDIF